MGSKRIRITGKRRAEPDIDKLAQALLRLIEQMQQQEADPQRKEAPTTGGEPSSHTESAA